MADENQSETMANTETDVIDNNSISTSIDTPELQEQNVTDLDTEHRDSSNNEMILNTEIKEEPVLPSTPIKEEQHDDGISNIKVGNVVHFEPGKLDGFDAESGQVIPKTEYLIKETSQTEDLVPETSQTELLENVKQETQSIIVIESAATTPKVMPVIIYKAPKIVTDNNMGDSAKDTNRIVKDPAKVKMLTKKRDAKPVAESPSVMQKTVKSEMDTVTGDDSNEDPDAPRGSTIVKLVPHRTEDISEPIDLSSSSDSEELESGSSTSPANFINSVDSPVEIGGDESEGELCVDLLDSDDDNVVDGVWMYGKDITIKPNESTKSKQATKRKFIQNEQSDYKKLSFEEFKRTYPRTPVNKRSPPVSPAVRRDWTKSPHKRPVAKKPTIANGYQLPSIASRISNEVKKTPLKQLPATMKQKLMKKGIRVEAQLSHEYHTILQNSPEIKDEAKTRIKNLTKTTESLIQCLSSEDDDDDDDDDNGDVGEDVDDDADVDDADDDFEPGKPQTVKSVDAVRPDRYGDTKRFRCDECMVLFTSSKAYKFHTCVQGEATSPGQYRCTECDKRFHSKGHLMNHLGSHESVRNKRKYTCRFCHIVFAARSLQSKHEAEFHSDLLAFRCQHCELTFNSRMERSNHEKEARHGAWHAIPNQDMIDLTANFSCGELNQFPHNCKVCRRSFSRGSSLMQHMRSSSHKDRCMWMKRQKAAENKRKRAISKVTGKVTKTEVEVESD